MLAAARSAMKPPAERRRERSTSEAGSIVDPAVRIDTDRPDGRPIEAEQRVIGANADVAAQVQLQRRVADDDRLRHVTARRPFPDLSISRNCHDPRSAHQLPDKLS